MNPSIWINERAKMRPGRKKTFREAMEDTGRRFGRTFANMKDDGCWAQADTPVVNEKTHGTSWVVIIAAAILLIVAIWVELQWPTVAVNVGQEWFVPSQSIDAPPNTGQE